MERAKREALAQKQSQNQQKHTEKDEKTTGTIEGDANPPGGRHKRNHIGLLRMPGIVKDLHLRAHRIALQKRIPLPPGKRTRSRIKRQTLLDTPPRTIPPRKRPTHTPRHMKRILGPRHTISTPIHHILHQRNPRILITPKRRTQHHPHRPGRTTLPLQSRTTTHKTPRHSKNQSKHQKLRKQHPKKQPKTQNTSPHHTLTHPRKHQNNNK